ncbi:MULTISPECIES: aromatase/cyclase [Streptomyces]|jgi:ribosome-associated toxin RatA of RatAB toxin-antitoxin module|uniref:Ribosome-associated toxin RatA of RatAB toxin-antitoxin module n=2 Tax=Streptomyces TaxID=1883 RepID=A0ABT9L9X8_STRGD|nr:MULTISPECIES: aromatase/cyclase [Streptomyces]MDP9680521.1 ribosome-associated toxin RatA of RatAB toxin-antitoxin module [Streptomyces griseoviridis]GGT08450.1 cyclase [Streptomyces griseoviridis]GGU49858.1 cyclase [Streptomyces daghestanicus]GHI28951.1 cyclase [Streptomyces daghestanicus]
MPHVVLHALTDAVEPAEAYRRISDFRRYPEFTDTVREVRVEPPLPDGSTVSDWAVVFRGGLMRWRERDSYAPETHSLAFEQTSGDFQSFSGGWRCEPHGTGTRVVFTADFDLGIPSLAEILDPVAESTLRHLIGEIVKGLLGAEVTDERAATARG